MPLQVTLPDADNHAAIEIAFTNQSGTGAADAHVFEDQPVISSIDALLPKDGGVDISIAQGKQDKYAAYEYSLDGGANYSTLAADKVEHLGPNKMKLMIESLTNLTEYSQVKIRARNSENFECDWVLISSFTPSKIPSKPDITSVERHRDTDLVDIEYEQDLAETTLPTSITVTYIKLDNSTATQTFNLTWSDGQPSIAP